MTDSKRYFVAALVAVILVIAGWSVARADIPTPAVITAYFTAGGQPFDAPVDFEIACWGYRSNPGEPEKEPGTYTPEIVYTYTDACPGYACALEHDLYFNYIHIDSCDVSGQAGGQPFRVENYAEFPFDCADFMQEPVACSLRVDLPVPSIPPAPASQSYERRFLVALLLTWIIEVPIVFLMARFVFKVRQVSGWRILWAGLLASALTLPYLWFLLPSILSTASGIYLGEVLVFLVEALLYRWLLGLSYPKALLLSFSANALSFLLGLFLL